MDKNIKISIVIPTYDQKGMAKEYLTHSFNILSKQTFKDFEVVVTDNSETDMVKKVCERFSKRLNINYYRNDHNLGMSGNTNEGIKRAKGELVKILFMDDYLYSDTAIEEIVDGFRGNWLVTACEHSNDGKTCFKPFYPSYNPQIYAGVNTISSPSVLTIKNDNPLFFDEGLVWLMDCDYYKRCFDKFGPPTVLNKINVVNRISEYQTTSTLMEEVKRAEVNLMRKRYEHTN